MTMTAVPPQRVTGHPGTCKCDPCRRLRYRHKIWLEIQEAQTGRRRMIDAAPARKIVQGWVDVGWSRPHIAHVIDYDQAGVQALLKGQPTIHYEYVDRIMARRPTYQNAPTWRETEVPAFATRRRIEGLYFLGYPRGWINDRLPAPVLLHRLTDGRRIWLRNHNAVRALADQIGDRPGPSQHARDRAFWHGYFPPAAWDNVEAWDCRPRL